MSCHCLKNAMIAGVFRKKITSQLNSGYVVTQREGVTSKDEVPFCASVDHCSLFDEHLAVLVHSGFQLCGNKEVGIHDMIERIMRVIGLVRVQDDFTVPRMPPEALR
jgi:hypothetical protein